MKTNYNPDVLTCLANLSNDEVFTPPHLANQMLDMLPEELWRNKDAKFLDPVCKSGVFLREIAKRLNEGLKEQIPDLQQRLNHIYRNQLYGIAITELTSLVSRRSVYCSRLADGKYSVCEGFGNEQGNILFSPTEHIWHHGKCTYCGASRNQKEYNRNSEYETYAYPFIHTNQPENFFPNMKFDIIVGNPPYQLNDGGFGASASPLYHKFIQQAKKLKPKYLTMIVPSRWFSGGKGLGTFRDEMLNDNRIRKIVDYENATECFPGSVGKNIGSVCYFLWERDTTGLCEIVNSQNGIEISSIRPLNEFNTFVRHGRAISIIRKVLAKNEIKMNRQVSSRKPFGLQTTVRPQRTGDITLRWQKGEGPYKRGDISVGTQMIDQWKVITSYASYDHAGSPGKDGKRRIFSKIDILPPGTICTETYLVIGSYNKESHAKNLSNYMKTKFFRFMVLQSMSSQHITKDVYSLVPMQNFEESWTDEKLYKKYSLTEEEIAFIESMIRPMDAKTIEVSTSDDPLDEAA